MRRGRSHVAGPKNARKASAKGGSARLSNAQDTRLGGALADSITCNAVVKSFGAESREDARLDGILRKWSARTYRTWGFATLSGALQLSLLLGVRTLIAFYAVFLWWRGLASVGDVTFVLTSYFVVHGYLRDVGQHVVFDHGRIVEEGPHDSLLRKPGGTYRRLFEKQALGLVADVQQELWTAND
jgi:ABC-type multidrug transport system fused ATPase/permease subunit